MITKQFSLIYFFIIAFLVSGISHAQEVQVGFGTETGQKLPVAPYYNYSYSQQIYPASEIGDTDGGTITHLKFYYHGNGISHSNDWTIYIGHTNKVEFVSSTDWIPVSNLTQVFSGNIGTVSADGWVTIDITDWTYNGNDNIVVAVDENQSGYDQSSDTFYCTSSSNARSIEYHADGTNPDPSSPPSGTTKNYFPNIVFVGLEATCPMPANATATQQTETDVLLSWDANGGTQWELEWGPRDFSLGSGTRVTNLTQTSHQLTGVNYGEYDYYVRADCGSGTYSNWVGPVQWTQAYMNSSCSHPMTLTVYGEGNGNGNEVTQNTNYSTPSSMSHTSCDGYGDNYDLFYTFTAPANGAVSIITGGTKGSHIEAAIYDNCGGSELQCFSEGSRKNVTGLTGGNTYILQIWHDNTNVGEFNIVLEEFTPLANDDCSGAKEVAALPYHDSMDATTATNNNGSITVCSNAMNDGVWYKFTVDQVNGDVTVTVTPNGWNAELGVYEGTDCNALSCVGRSDGGGSGSAESVQFTPTAGSTYYVNVGYWNLNDGEEGPFTLDISGNVTLSKHNILFRGFNLYPNPTKGLISWHSGQKVQTITVTDLAGKIMLRIKNPGQSVDISQLSRGTYLLHVQIRDTQQSFIIIKQ